MYKASNITPLEDIESTLAEIQAFITVEPDNDNPTLVVDRMNHLSAYMAISGKLLADAKYHYNDVLNSKFVAAIKEAGKANMATTTVNEYIKTIGKDYQHLVDWSDRVNRACTHQLECARSILSKLKAEMNTLNYTR